MKNSYDDIINLPHHVSATRPQMSMIDRAAQFSPFAALTGYDAAIQETGRLTDQRIEPDVDILATLNMKFQILLSHIQESPEVRFTYFKPDERKPGGAYLTLVGVVEKLLEEEHKLLLQSGVKIPIQDIIAMDSPIFSGIE